jgi:hypothetical protein
LERVMRGMDGNEGSVKQSTRLVVRVATTVYCDRNVCVVKALFLLCIFGLAGVKNDTSLARAAVGFSLRII